jgi:hypothetical protein
VVYCISICHKNKDSKKLGEILPNEYSQSSLRTAATALNKHHLNDSNE